MLDGFEFLAVLFLIDHVRSPDAEFITFASESFNKNDHLEFSAPLDYKTIGGIGVLDFQSDVS